MLGLTNKDLFAVIWIGLCLIAFLYSFGTYGYLVWFKPTDFMKMNERKKKNSPRWLGFFMMSTTSLQDLWIVRIAYLIVCIIILFSLALLILRLS